MAVNSVNSVNNTVYESTTQTSNTRASQEKSTNNTTPAATYEKNHNTTNTSKSNSAIVAQMKSDLQNRQAQLRSLVEKMMTKQGQASNKGNDIFSLLREGKLNVDPETRAQAQKDISEDGYWGVKQTSDRLVSFAQALSGGDATKADELINAMKKGFDQATKAWGGELPGICKDTIDTAIEKMEKWKNGLEEEA